MAEVDAVVHFAAETHVDRSILGAADFVMTNVVGTQTLLDAAAAAPGVEKFVHVSTDEVYGSIAEGSWDEEQPLEPNSPYSASKASSDLLARAYHRTHGLPVCITRCSNNYGPYQFPEKVIPLFVTNLIDGAHGAAVRRGRQRPRLAARRRPLPRHPPGARAAAAPGEVYNIGGGTELTNKELTGLLLEATGADWDRVRHVKDRLGHDLRYSVDITKIRTELGYEPRCPSSRASPRPSSGTATNRAWWEPLKARAQLTDVITARRSGAGLVVRRQQAELADLGQASGPRRPWGRAAGSRGAVARPVVGQSMPIAGSSGWMPCSRPGA